MDDFWDCEFYKPFPRNLLNLAPADAKQAVKDIPRVSDGRSYSQMEQPSNLRWLKVSGADVCFRASPNSASASKTSAVQEDEPKRPLFLDTELLEKDEDLENIFHVVEDSSGQFKFSSTLPLPCALFGFIIGQRGAVKINIENSTKTKILIPPRSEDLMGKIVIRGHARDDVQAACRKIHHIVQTNRTSISPNYFVGIMVESAEIKEAFNKFRSICSLDVSVLQATEKLHLTLGALVLLNEEEVAAAASIVQDFVQEVLCDKAGQLKLQLQGLEIMQDDPSMTRVLYGDVLKDEDHDFVQDMCKELNSRLDNAGYLKKNKSAEGVKLHMTLANSSFAARKNPNWRQNKTDFSFDASSVLQKFKDVSFGQLLVESLCICECGSSTEENGYVRVSQHFLDSTKNTSAYICKR